MDFLHGFIVCWGCLKVDMSSRFSHTNGFTKLIVIAELSLLSYLIFSLTSNVYESYRIDSYIADFEAENELLEKEIAQQNADYLYFTSPEYIDRIAKQNLGLVNAGEMVIVLSPEVFGEDEAEEVVDTGYFAVFSGSSNVQDWWEFFFN